MISPSYHHGLQQAGMWPSQQQMLQQQMAAAAAAAMASQQPQAAVPAPLPSHQPNDLSALQFHLQREQAFNMLRNGARFFDPRFNLPCKFINN